MMGWQHYLYLFAVVELKLCYSSEMEQNLPRGHLQPLGGHADPDTVPEFNPGSYPTPEEFWKKFVKPSKPAVFRGATKSWGGYTKWTDEYLIKNYGDFELRLEGRKEKFGRTPYGVLGVGRDTMEHFVKSYHNPDHKGYIVTELPEPMYHEAGVLPFMTCGTFRHQMVEVDFWMNGGNASSVLHKDAFNTVNCLLNGTKEWKLIALEQEKNIYKAWEAAPSFGGYSKINVHSVDLHKYPKVSQVPWQFTKIEKGDCLFLPKGMYHNVLSYGSNNVAVALLFSRFDRYKKRDLDFSDCDNVTQESKPLSDFIVDWMYPGKGDLSMGNADLEDVRIGMLENVNKKGIYTLKRLIKAVHKIYSEKDIKFARDYATKAYETLTNGAENLTQEMIRAFSKEKLRVAAMCFERVDPSNAPWFEYNSIDPEAIKETLLLHLKKHKGNLSREKFLEVYVEGLEGSQTFGNRFFDILGGENANTVSQEMAKRNLPIALEKYNERQVEGEEAATPEIYRQAKKPSDYDEGDVDTMLEEEKRERTKRYLVGDDEEEQEEEQEEPEDVADEDEEMDNEFVPINGKTEQHDEL
ncbi:uncharacterized protein LOC135686878 [Rhopilema esculentum]|uniref:uncharacterized protein LOC135686878 n=1 Tax=Rhopilema esculentum TaxID=499914 RepID=UPI0031D1A18D